MSFRTVALATILISVAILATSPARADRGYYGATGVFVGEPTTAGDWSGTWMYVWRDGRIALWFRNDKAGKPEIRLQFQSTSNPETFETDWSGKATYYLSGQPAAFSFVPSRRDAEEIAGRWNWTVDFTDSGRSEIGDVRIFRVGDGRLLAFEFQKGYAKTVRRGDRVTSLDNPPVFNFVKVSRRIVLWDEIPW